MFFLFFLLDLFDSGSNISSLVFFHWKLLLASIPVGFSLKSEFSVRKHVYGIPLVCSFIVLGSFCFFLKCGFNRYSSYLFVSGTVLEQGHVQRANFSC